MKTTTDPTTGLSTAVPTTKELGYAAKVITSCIDLQRIEGDGPRTGEAREVVKYLRRIFWPAPDPKGS
ncbi:MAG: hypothetical protein HQ581_22395 [Planctomycetes bacterium]|nr:hypothetical protein [Planctomycetota bacterium]